MISSDSSWICSSSFERELLELKFSKISTISLKLFARTRNRTSVSTFCDNGITCSESVVLEQDKQMDAKNRHTRILYTVLRFRLKNYI